MAERSVLPLVMKVGSAAVVGLMVAGAAAASAPLDATKPDGATGGSRPLFLEPPPPPALADLLNAPTPSGPGQPPPSGIIGSPLGIPVTVLKAYERATDSTGKQDPSCALPISLLAAIGRVESNHARGGALDGSGTALMPILGPRLDGSNGTARISDSDKGYYDFDREFDRAVGPMQFIPRTWRGWSLDGNKDGERNPQNVFDASLTSARYLCAGERSMSKPEDLKAAILSYNNSEEYLQVVLAWMDVYAKGAAGIPNGSGSWEAAPTQPSPTPSPSSSPSPKSSTKPAPAPAPKEKTPEEEAREQLAEPWCEGAESGEQFAEQNQLPNPLKDLYDPAKQENCPTPSPSPMPTSTASSQSGGGGPLGGL